MSDTSLWHPFADMAAVRGSGLAISPPLIVTVEQVREIAGAVRAAIDELDVVEAAA